MPTPKPVSDHVGARIREERKRYKLTPADLAERCQEDGHPDLTTNTIKDIESGRRYPDGTRRRGVELDELFAIAKALNCVPAYLMPGQLLGGNFLGSLDKEGLRELGDAIQVVLSLVDAGLA